MNTLFLKEFIQQSVYRIAENTNRVIKCLQEIDDTQAWQRPNENSNSIGNIILHLCGNIRQYAISSLGKTEDVRVRDKEFSINGGFDKKELSAKLKNTVDEAIDIIENLNEAELIKLYSVQGFTLSGVGIIIHVTEHYSYHTGQIAFWIKILKNKDLGLYANIDLNVKNRN
ncbi:MAG: DinB family protein [Bacteroidia bacterium]